MLQDAVFDDIYCPLDQDEPIGWVCTCGSFQPDDEKGVLPDCLCCTHTFTQRAQSWVTPSQITLIQ